MKGKSNSCCPQEGSHAEKMGAIRLCITKESFRRISDYAEETAKHVGEGKVEDELEGKLAKLLEEAITEDYEGGSNEGKARGCAVKCDENPAIVDR